MLSPRNSLRSLPTCAYADYGLEIPSVAVSSLLVRQPCTNAGGSHHVNIGGLSSPSNDNANNSKCVPTSRRRPSADSGREGGDSGLVADEMGFGVGGVGLLDFIKRPLSPRAARGGGVGGEEDEVQPLGISLANVTAKGSTLRPSSSGCHPSFERVSRSEYVTQEIKGTGLTGSIKSDSAPPTISPIVDPIVPIIHISSSPTLVERVGRFPNTNYCSSPRPQPHTASKRPHQSTTSLSPSHYYRERVLFEATGGLGGGGLLSPTGASSSNLLECASVSDASILTRN